MLGENHHLEQYHPSKEEYARLEELWNNGDLNNHITYLIDFAKTYRNQILTLAGADPDLREILLTTKRQIIKIGSVNRKREMSDQIQAIHDEIWIRGEKGDRDRFSIQQDWAKRYAKPWRHWRIKEYLFTIDYCGERLKEIFFSTKPGS